MQIKSLCCIVLTVQVALSVAQDSCSQFSVVGDESDVTDLVQITDTLTSVSVDVNETVSVESILYVVSWTSDLTTAPYVKEEENNDALDYVTYLVDDEAKTMTVSLDQTVEGIIDFTSQERTENLELNLYFEFSLLELPCQLYVDHILLDENTQSPYFEADEQEVSVREDFPIGIPISDLQPIAYDLDATTPNNQFEAAMNADCPLETSEADYTCVDGEPVQVFYQLRTPLDYDTMVEPYTYVCTVTLTDFGIPSLSTTAQVTVTVEPYSDEEPVFTSQFYKGNLLESTAGSVVDTEPLVEAYDQDVPPSPVTYTMEGADATVGADAYFGINQTTGVITIINDLDNEILSNGQVEFILTVCDSSSECNVAFLDVTLPVLSPGDDFLEFEQLIYTVQELPPEQGEEVLRVHAQTSGSEEDIGYSFEDDGSEGLNYFTIDETSGVISTIKDETPSDQYVLTAIATDGTLTAEATVNIVILLPVDGTITIDESLRVVTVAENEQASVATLEAEGAKFFCLLAVEPEAFIPYFAINSTSGELRVVEPLDADDTDMGNKVSLKAAAYEDNTECLPSPITNQLMSNEEVIEVLISDINEFPPEFVDAAGNPRTQMLFAFPREKTLQRAVGPVGTVKAEDLDATSNIKFSVDSTGSFIIDDVTGEIFSVGDFDCSTECKFNVYAADYSDFNTELSVQVNELDMDHIFTMSFENVEPNDVEGTIMETSSKANISINLLYSNVISGDTAKALKDAMRVDAQVYATDGMRLLDLTEFNNILGTIEETSSAQSFSDKDVFETAADYKTATIVLGCFLGAVVVLFAVYIGFTLFTGKKKRKMSAKHISTLGNAYQNPNYQNDENSQPTFSSIFGDLPGGSNSISDGTSQPKNSSDSRKTSQEEISTAGASVYVSSSYSSPYDDLKKDKGKSTKTTNKDIIASRKDSQTSQKAETKIYPSIQITSDYENEISAVATEINESMDRISIPIGSTITTHPTAPPESDLDQDDISSTTSSDKKSNLKMYPDLTYGEETKSVAFKVLVDTKEFETDEDDPAATRDVPSDSSERPKEEDDTEFQSVKF